MSELELVSEAKCFGGWQRTWRHPSTSTGTAMRFSLYLPPAAEEGPVPVLWYLSGLTCTEENVTVKAGFQRWAAERGLAVVCPDTSPRGLGLEGEDDDWDFGSGAGFYVDATRSPWASHYRMDTYVTVELPALLFGAGLPLDADRQGITGHSMGGHGALVLALRNPGRYRSVSAFAPITHPTAVPWGEKAFGGYLGEDREAWARYDAVELIDQGARCPELLVDQGTKDSFLDRQLRPGDLEEVCARAGQPLTLRRQEGYDHSYFFIATFMGEHVAWHADRLTAR